MFLFFYIFPTEEPLCYIINQLSVINVNMDDAPHNLTQYRTPKASL